MSEKTALILEQKNKALMELLERAEGIISLDKHNNTEVPRWAEWLSDYKEIKDVQR